MTKRRITMVCRLGITFILLLTMILSLQRNTKSTRETIIIGIAENPNIQDFNTNFFTKWLEEKSGLDIEFKIFPQNYTLEYLDEMFRSGTLSVDALFSFPQHGDIATINSAMAHYGELGYIIPLNTYIEDSTIMKSIFQDFTEYDLKEIMTSSDGNIYYLPGLDTSMDQYCQQVFWMNADWLKALHLEIPQTTEELMNALSAFKNHDPNGNGIKDEIPLAGSKDLVSEQSFNFIINAFVYNDVNNSRMFVEDDRICFAPLTPEWRQAIIYLNQLYTLGLLDEFQFTLDHEQFVQLANDPRDLLGAFTSKSINDVLLQSSPDILNKFIRVAPLIGDEGVQYSTVRTPLPSPNGVITASCKNPDAVFRLFELMLTEEAFLIGRYGEEGIDWENAKPGELDALGNQAVLQIKTQLFNTSQNKQLLELGPFLTYSAYSDGASWDGLQSNHAYIDIRAYSLYRQFQPPNYVKAIYFNSEDSLELLGIKSELDSYTHDLLIQFITGELDPMDDSTWDSYTQTYTYLGIDEFLPQVQLSYTSLKE